MKHSSITSTSGPQTKVNELMTLCDILKARLAAAQTTQLHLADTIVEQAVA
jgi:type I restriction enzyme S subunit